MMNSFRQAFSCSRAFRRILQTLAIAFTLFRLGAPLLSAQTSTCPVNDGPAGKDFHGQTIREGNFIDQDLTNANFSGAILEAPTFTGAKLTGANFTNVHFTATNNPEDVADFTSADVSKACFRGALFQALTYFTQTTLTCADFSGIDFTDITNGNAVFDDDQLTMDRTQKCRLAFQSATMPCNFIGDWRYLDLTNAVITACLGDLKKQSFSSAQMAGVHFDGANLDGAVFSDAYLAGASFQNSSLQGANFRTAKLYGAALDHANLTGANFYGALLSNYIDGNYQNAATATHAHFKNANLSSATISGVDFTNANFYGDFANPQSSCKIAATPSACNSAIRRAPGMRITDPAPTDDPYDGFACGCAAAHNATVYNTQFVNSYLFGVDFTGAKMQGASFTNAVLTGANFSGASFKPDNSGAATNFSSAFLQGANLTAAIDPKTKFDDAYVDFRVGGNNLYVYLDGQNHNQFACSQCTPSSGTDVCVQVNYPVATAVPSSGLDVTCPDGSVGDCGKPDPSGKNTKWRSTIQNPADPPNGVPPSWYDMDSTYFKAPINTSSVCKGLSPTVLW
jgi:uncharacterized protein YjbI with pentapeptide repeats